MGKSSHYSTGSRVGRRGPFMNAASLLEGVFPGEGAKQSTAWHSCTFSGRDAMAACLLSGALVHWLSVAEEQGCERGHTHHCIIAIQILPQACTHIYIYIYIYISAVKWLIVINLIQNKKNVCIIYVCVLCIFIMYITTHTYSIYFEYVLHVYMYIHTI